MSEPILLRFQSQLENAFAALDAILDALRQRSVDKKIAYRIHLALEELLVNVVSYAYGPEGGEITVAYEVTDSPKTLIVTIRDRGTPFNPLEEVEEPDVSAPATERKIGGLGIFLARKTMDDVRYSWQDGENVLMVLKRLE